MIDEGSLSATARGRGVFLTRSNSMVSWPTLRSNAAILASYQARLNFLGGEFAAIKLREPQSSRLADRLYLRPASLRPTVPLQMS